MLSAQITSQQERILEGIAQWIADRSWYIEKYGCNTQDFEKYHDTIISLFEEADRAGIPYWVQNSVIVWAEDLRQRGREYIYQLFDRKNIIVID